MLQGLTGLLALAVSLTAQTSTTGFAPSNFGNFILTSTPSNATGATGVSTIYTSSGSQFTFGTGGNLVNPAQFNYVVTGPNTATLSNPASGSNAASTTNLVFTGPNSGTYTTVSGTQTSTGRFGLAEIPSSAPIQNVSARTTLTSNGSSTVGFVIAGSMPRRVLIRAVGPGLSSFGVTNAITNPQLSLYRGTQLLATNDDWGTLQPISSAGTSSGGTSSGGSTTGGSTTGGTSTGTGSTSGGSTSGGSTSGTSSTGTSSSAGFFTGSFATGGTFTTQMAAAADYTEAGAFGLQSGSRDAAFVVTLPPGAYTVIVRNSATVTASTGGTSGGTTTGTGSTSTGTTSGGSTSGTTTTGTSSTSDGTSTGGSTSGGTTTGGSTTGGSTTGTGSTSGSTTGTGSTSGGTTTGGTTTGGSTTGSGTTSGGSTSGTTTTGTTSTGTAATATVTAGDVLVEVYFME